MESHAVKNAATAKLINITTTVYCAVCFLVGQLTRLNSVLTSFRNSVNLAIIIPASI